MKIILIKADVHRRPYKNVLESELLVQVAAGDRKLSQGILNVTRRWSMIFQQAHPFKIQAEEIVQNVFIRIWLKDTPGYIENFGAYLNQKS
ncbi:hypothetical protein CS542_06765 [Pedobacter sp. IW39]|nr:hypothetical protein CS542_06765 [Pedobacter sp. IW39]